MHEKKQAVKAVDAVMGTGKSTWVMLTMGERRTVIVVPRLSEVERYERDLKDLDGVVALTDSDTDKRTKKTRFIEALMDAQVIITTHQLFEDHLTSETFETIKQGEWWLVLDEVPVVFDPVKLVSGTVIDGYVAKGFVQEEKLNDKVSKLTVNPLTYKGYCDLPASEATANEKRMLLEATKKDVLIVKKEDQTRGFTIFSLREERLDAFKGVTVLTYPFKGSDLDYWLKIKGYLVEHYELTRHAKTHSLDDFSLQPHSGEYSGGQFKDLIEMIGDKPQRGKKIPYGDKSNHFSANEMRGMKAKDKKLDSTKVTLRREFRNKADMNRWADNEDFMFTCLKESVPLWADKDRKLNVDFIGPVNHVPFNTIATNDYSHKTQLAFLYNVFQFPEISNLVEAFDLECDENQYSLYTIIQWVWRSAIREGHKVRLYIPSKRMRDTLSKWLNNNNNRQLTAALKPA
ncbi:MAG: DEAD/DEAH box helicase family protein [Desulforhopalus sp.]